MSPSLESLEVPWLLVRRPVRAVEGTDRRGRVSDGEMHREIGGNRGMIGAASEEEGVEPTMTAGAEEILCHRKSSVREVEVEEMMNPEEVEAGGVAVTWADEADRGEVRVLREAMARIGMAVGEGARQQDEGRASAGGRENAVAVDKVCYSPCVCHAMRYDCSGLIARGFVSSVIHVLVASTYLRVVV